LDAWTQGREKRDEGTTRTVKPIKHFLRVHDIKKKKEDAKGLVLCSIDALQAFVRCMHLCCSLAVVSPSPISLNRKTTSFRAQSLTQGQRNKKKKNRVRDSWRCVGVSRTVQEAIVFFLQIVDVTIERGREGVQLAAVCRPNDAKSFYFSLSWPVQSGMEWNGWMNTTR
jgi:hypothetical protein